MSTMNPDRIPRRNDELVWRSGRQGAGEGSETARSDEDEVYICSADGETLFTLADVAADIWHACDGRRDVAAIVDLLLESYEVARDELEGDVAAFLADLEARGLLLFD